MHNRRVFSGVCGVELSCLLFGGFPGCLGGVLREFRIAGQGDPSGARQFGAESPYRSTPGDSPLAVDPPGPVDTVDRIEK